MKKILIVTLEFPPQIGGIASYVSQLCEAFPSDRIVLLAPSLPYHESEISTSYTIIRRRLLWPRLLWPRWTLLVWQVWRIVRKEKVEIIIIHHLLPVGYAASVIKKFLHIPYMIFCHGTDFLMSSKTTWKKRLATAVLTGAEQILCNSESLAKRFTREWPILASRTTVLYPCPRKEFFIRPPETALHLLRSQLALDGKKVLLSVSRLNDGKGFPHLLHVFPEIIARVPNVVWLIVGEGPKRAELVTSVQKMGLQNVVRFLGSVPHDALMPYFAIADLFVLLTHPDTVRGEEGLGMVFLEAAAAGLPVIAGKSGGVEEAVLHAQTGLVLDIYQKKQVVEAIVQLLEQESFARALGQAGRERVSADFQWQHQVAKLSQWIT